MITVNGLSLCLSSWTVMGNDLMAGVDELLSSKLSDKREYDLEYWIVRNLNVITSFPHGVDTLRSNVSQLRIRALLNLEKFSLSILSISRYLLYFSVSNVNWTFVFVWPTKVVSTY